MSTQHLSDADLAAQPAAYWTGVAYESLIAFTRARQAELGFTQPGAAPGRPQRLASRLADERPGELEPDPRVLTFRAELLRRWPGLADLIGPWHDDLDWRQP